MSPAPSSSYIPESEFNVQASEPSPMPTARPITRPSPTPSPMPTPMPRQIQPNTNFDALMELMAQKSQSKGFHPAVPISQMAAESERGGSRRARETNNYFGLGAYTDESPGMKFNSPEESMDYYLNLIETDPRYKQAYEQRMNSKPYLDALINVPYATDPNYRNMILNTPEYRKYANY
jgi:flagellum-specific peptidoglycan hydrolase FlgJ